MLIHPCSPFVSRCVASLALLLLLAGCQSDRAVEKPAVAPPTPTQLAVTRAIDALYGDIREHTLPNGLRIYIKPIPGSATVTTMVAYRVGSADEDKQYTGLSHYLEHLLFKGTDKLMPGDIDRLTLRHGGANNAYTDNDCTVYHFDFAADQWDTGLAIEADRMRNTRIDEKHEFELEKGAVIAELERNEDEPWDLEYKAIAPLLFGNGPYGHPVIGETAHVKAATAQVIKAHYDRWYHPDNAAVVVCGGVDPDKAIARITELLGPIPKGPDQPRVAENKLVREGPVRKEIKSKFAAPRMVMGYNTVPIAHADEAALDVICQVLAGGKASRLYRKMVEEDEQATDVSSWNQTGRYPGWLSVTVELLPGKSPGAAEQTVLAELKRIAAQPVNAQELERAKRAIIASTIFRGESAHDLADMIARAAVQHDLSFLRSYLTGVLAVTAEDVQAAATKYLNEQQRVVVWSLPQEEKASRQADSDGVAGPIPLPPREGLGEGRPDDSIRVGTSNSFATTAAVSPSPRPSLGGRGAGIAPRRLARHNLADAAPTALPSLAATQRVVLPNGLTLLLLEDRRLPIITAAAEVKNIRLHEPADKAGVAELTGRLLAEGTDRHSGRQIADLIENVGGELSLDDSGGSLKVLSPDAPLGLGLLLECLRRANFPQEAFDRQQAAHLADIEDGEHQPDQIAMNRLRASLYGKHPLGRPGLGHEATVSQLTRADCVALHRLLFVPSNTVIAIAGDFDAKQMAGEIRSLAGDWFGAPPPLPALPKVAPPATAEEITLPVPDAVQAKILIAHPGIRRSDPNYYKLMVLDYIFGTGPGFTDRLTSRIRDREGLCYSISGQITGSAGVEPGLFLCAAGTAPKHITRVKTEIVEEIERLRKEPPGEQDVADVKAYLLRSLPLRVTTAGDKCSTLLAVERYGLGFNYFEDFARQVGAVTPKDVLEIARKHLHPEKLLTIVAGAVKE